MAIAVAALPQLYAGQGEAHEESLDVTVRNITGGQPLTPPIVVVHDGSAELLPSNADSLEGLEELAEAG